MTIPELLQSRHRIIEEAEGLTASAVAEERGMSPAEGSRFDSLMQESRELTRRMDEERALSGAAGKLSGQ